MKRIVDGKACTVTPGIYPVGGGKHARGYAVHAAGKSEGGRFLGVAYRKADGWYCRGVACDAGERFGGGLMKDAIRSMIKKGGN